VQCVATHELYFVLVLSQKRISNYNALQRTATRCNTLQHTVAPLQRIATYKLYFGFFFFGSKKDFKLPNSATLYDALQHTSHTPPPVFFCKTDLKLQHAATHCNAQQHTATLCNALQRTATCPLFLDSFAKVPLICNTLHCAATHCNTLQHPATHYNALQHTATHLCSWAFLPEGPQTATHCNTLHNAAT